MENRTVSVCGTTWGQESRAVLNTMFLYHCDVIKGKHGLTLLRSLPQLQRVARLLWLLWQFVSSGAPELWMWQGAEFKYLTQRELKVFAVSKIYKILKSRLLWDIKAKTTSFYQLALFAAWAQEALFNSCAGRCWWELRKPWRPPAPLRGTD